MDQVIPENRVCVLFAAYHPRGFVDDVDLHMLDRLQQKADIFYFVNHDTMRGEDYDAVSARVRMIVGGEHRELDFGSWRRLIDTVGWDLLDEYEHIIMMNNSLIPVGDVGAFIERACSAPERFFSPMLLDEHFSGPMLPLADYLERNNPYHASCMFPSFFWRFSRPFLREPWVRHFFQSIREEQDRLTVCYKYERGFTRSVLRHGVEYGLQVDVVHPHAAVYTHDAFNLVRRGVPFLKRKLLSQEFYVVPNLRARVEGLARTQPPTLAAALLAELGLSELDARVRRLRRHLQDSPSNGAPILQRELVSLEATKARKGGDGTVSSRPHIRFAPQEPPSKAVQIAQPAR